MLEGAGSMDIGTVLADKALLTSLSREYELLKATNGKCESQQFSWPLLCLQQHVCTPASLRLMQRWGVVPCAADVDWQQWITARLQRAAASRVSVETPNHAASSQKQQGLQQGRQQAVNLRTTSLSRAPARSQPGRFTSSSRSSSAADVSIRESAAQDRPPPTWQVCKPAGHVEPMWHVSAIPTLLFPLNHVYAYAGTGRHKHVCE